MWNGKKKAVTFCYDDGVTQDRRLVEMMNTYGVKGTFNLNSGMQSYANVWEHPKGLLIHRMNTEGLKELYQGHDMQIFPNMMKRRSAMRFWKTRKIWKNGLGSLLWEWRIRLVLITIQ